MGAMIERSVRAVFFDLDGTLLDSLPGIRYSAEAAFAACGLVRSEVDLRGLIGPPIRTILANMSRGVSESELDALEQAFRVSYDSEAWKRTPHYAGAAETLRVMRAEGTLGLFDEVVTRDSREPAYAGKLEMLVHLLRKWEMRAEECLMVGDTIEDAEAASDCGMQFCLMTHGYGEVPIGSSVPVAFRCDHFSELIPGLAEEQQR